MQAELKQLWKVTRPEVTRRVSEAAALGDRSENAEYIYGKKQLREIDSRIRYLAKRLDEVLVVDRAPTDHDTVYFGAWVRLAAAGEQLEFRIVGADEFDRHPDYISIDSPVARRLVGKSLGDRVALPRGEAETELQIVAIRYGP